MAKIAQQVLLPLALIIGAFAFGWYVYLNASQWEPLLVGVGVLVAILGMWGWQRGPKRLKWIASGVGWFGVISAAIFADELRWPLVAGAIIVMALIASSVVFSASLPRLDQLLARSMFPVPPALAMEASQPVVPYLYDDPGAEKVYPSRSLLLRYTFGSFVIIILCIAAALFCLSQLDSSQQDSFKAGAAFIGSLFGALYFALLLMADAIQFVHPRPLLTLHRDSFVSTTGPFSTGPGIVRWREIVQMSIRGSYGGSYGSRASRRQLVLLVANPQALLARQSWFNRAVQRLYTGGTSLSVNISERVLPLSLEELQNKILPYIKRAHGDKWDDELSAYIGNDEEYVDDDDERD